MILVSKTVTTQSLPVTKRSQTVVLTPQGLPEDPRTLRILNDGRKTVFLRFGFGAAVIAHADGTDMAMLGNTEAEFSLPADADRVAVIAGSLGSVIRITQSAGN